MKLKINYLLFTLIILTISSCKTSSDKEDLLVDTVESKDQMGFELLSATKTGIHFINSITETEDRNIFNFEYMYNGGGVAVGDINNDGLVDIYFTGNDVSDKLYLNKGDMVFEDITNTAFQHDMAGGWHTGVNFVDINADGYLDIYVGLSGITDDRSKMENLLFINNHDNTFSEKGEEYGVNCNKRTTHSAFFDYDNDGDLDLYILNHPKTNIEDTITNEELMRIVREGEDADVLLRNDNGNFTDVSSKAGIRNATFGLGIAASDINNDGHVDIYISSDFAHPDFLYMNNGDGTFTDELRHRTNHVPNFSMGNEIADFNNDGFLDIMTLDMASEDHIRSKKNMGGMNPTFFADVVAMGFHYQYMFNVLQLNNGNGTFSDIGHLAGVSKTDWSWAPLFADFDNDGYKDLFITNGYKRDLRDVDYQSEYYRKSENDQIGDLKNELDLIPATKIKNYMFKNNGNLIFKNVAADWGLDVPINSNGAAYADLDNDGDLDLILNNMDDVASIFENTLTGSSNNYLRLKIDGYDKNMQAIGTKVTIYTEDGLQYQELHVSRGYISSVENTLHFGLGSIEIVDKIAVQWPDGTTLEQDNIKTNSVLNIKYADGAKRNLTAAKTAPLFRDIADSLLKFKHNERSFDDFKTEILLPNKLSQSGPFITKGDVNGDDLDDIYISGPAGGTGKLYLQTAVGFKEKSGPWLKEKGREEMDAVFFDVDGDQDLDLYVVSGGNEYNYNSPLLIDLLYINDGKGNFTNESNRLPQIPVGGQCVITADYDNDGDLDLFIGGRQVPGLYPYPPNSYIFQNNNGQFSDVTSMSPDLKNPGLITDAIFDDFDADGDLDLIVVGEWMPISFFQNNKGVFSNVTAVYNPNPEVGWWYSIEKGDFNKDGKMDFIVGNLGENNKFHPSKKYPLEIYCGDFDGNGTNDIVLAGYQDNICYPVRGRQCSSEQMPFIKDKFPTYDAFAKADLASIYGQDFLNNAMHYSATNFSSVVLLSENGGYKVDRLPVYCQLGPINRTLVDDYNKDGNLDILVVGNNFGVEVETIRYDGGRGVLLIGDGAGNFQQRSPVESGFFENNDCKDMVQLNFKDKTIVITVSNQAEAKTFLLKE